MRTIFQRWAIVAAAWCVSPALTAHHSNAMCDHERESSFEGVVTKYEWANPHIDVIVFENSGHALESPQGLGDSIIRRDAMELISEMIRR